MKLPDQWVPLYKESVVKSDRKVQYSLIRSARRSRVSMRIDDTGALVVSAPKTMSRQRIEDIVLKHTDWIERQTSVVRSLPGRLDQHTYRDGDLFLVLGNHVTLEVHKGPEESVVHDRQLLTVCSPSVSKRAVSALINRFYDSLGIEVYTPYVDRYLDALGLNSQEVTIGMAGYPKRLGSCSKDRHLSFSRRSLMLPRNLIEYVALHEVAHLVYFDHSKKFKDLIGHHMPDYRERIAEIKRRRLQISYL